MSQTALDSLLNSVAWVARREGDIEIRGDDPVLPTRFRVGRAGAAAIAASAVAAAELLALHTGSNQRQKIAVDLRHAVAALRSARYLRIDGTMPKDAFDPIGGLYQAGDQRWVFLHCNFPNHRAAALSVLGRPPNADKNAV